MKQRVKVSTVFGLCTNGLKSWEYCENVTAFTRGTSTRVLLSKAGPPLAQLYVSTKVSHYIDTFQDRDPDAEILSEGKHERRMGAMSPQERCNLLRKFDIMWLAPFCHVHPGNGFKIG